MLQAQKSFKIITRVFCRTDGIIQNQCFSLRFPEMLLRHMDGEIQIHLFSYGFLEMLLRHMDGEFIDFPLVLF